MMDQETDEEIRLMAYALWERDDRPHGRDLDYWYEAEQQLKISGGIGRSNPANDRVKIAKPKTKE